MKLTVIWLLLGLGTAFLTRAQPALRAGAATMDITPAIGTVMNGGIGPVPSTHVHDELLARCLVLDDGTNRLAFIVLDNCLVDRAFFDDAKRRIQAATGIAPTNVSLSTTHTHSAGAVIGVHLTEADEAYRAWLPGRLVDAVKRALNNLAPAELAWCRGAVPQHVFCRRILVKPGVTYTNQLGGLADRAKINWSSPQPEDDAVSGPVDPEVSFLSVRHADGRPLALLANYSLHYVGGTGPGHLSADYYGVFCARMAELLGAERQDPPFVALMSNGTSGDINNVDFRKGSEPKPPYAQIRIVADDVAREVHRAMDGLAYRREVPLRSAAAELRLANRKPTAAQVERARAIVHGRPPSQLGGFIENFARETLLVADLPDEDVLPLQIFRIGDLAIAQWPGEIFAVSGLELKARSPVRPLFNIGMANGWSGYIPPPGQHALGAYETFLGRTSHLETNATVKLADTFLELLTKLR